MDGAGRTASYLVSQGAGMNMKAENITVHYWRLGNTVPTGYTTIYRTLFFND